MISAVGAVYKNDKPEWIRESLESLLINSRKVDEIILVIDGFINNELQEAILEYESYLVLLYNDKNEGLAYSLNKGISVAKGDYILRFDSDDINLANRVEVLYTTIIKNQSLDVVGSYIKEFGVSQSLRKVPLSHSRIVEQMGRRCPISHPSVMFKKSAWKEVGGYPMDVFPEDYYFWLLLRKNNCQFLNIPDVLVNMRTTENYLERRIGMTYLRKEMKMLTVAWNRGLIDSLDLFYHILFKPIVRLQPARIFLVSLKLNRYLFK